MKNVKKIAEHIFKQVTNLKKYAGWWDNIRPKINELSPRRIKAKNYESIKKGDTIIFDEYYFEEDEFRAPIVWRLKGAQIHAEVIKIEKLSSNKILVKAESMGNTIYELLFEPGPTRIKKLTKGPLGGRLVGGTYYYIENEKEALTFIRKKHGIVI